MRSPNIERTIGGVSQQRRPLALDLGSQRGSLTRQPVEANQRHGIVQLSRHQSVPGLGERHDVNQNILVFVFYTVYPTHSGTVDQTTEQRDLFGTGTRAWVVTMELDQLEDVAACLLLRFPARNLRGGLAGLHQSGDSTSTTLSQAGS